jgi:hypothetical protein
MMAAIVTTLLYGPAAAVLFVLSFAVFGASFHSFVTFGDRLPAAVGLLVWWLVAFVPAFGYAAFAMPDQHGPP